MQKRYIMAPGPTAAAPEVLLKMAEPIMHHRSPRFSEILTEVREDLKWLFKTQNDVFILASSGTGAMEASVVNLLSPGDSAIVVRAGKFGERWAELCETNGIKPINIDITWGEAVRVEDIEKAINDHPEAKAVFIQAHETSTGVKHPIKEIGELLKDKNICFVVDAISAIGVYDIETDKWGLDIVVSGSQKAFGLPPGLSMLSVSQKAWSFIEESKCPRYYFNLLKEKKALNKKTTAFTSAVSLIIGLGEVLKDWKKQGHEKLFKHHKILAEATRAGITAMGLEIFSKVPSESITVVKAPEGINGQDVVKILREEFGITIAGGQAQLKGKIFRISHMGHLDQWDMIVALAAVERALKKLGHDVEFGKSIAAAQAYFAAHEE